MVGSNVIEEVRHAFTTRIAPSPTGDMHIGTARTAYFNWLVARASGGRFILRIDDTDVARNRSECIDVILKTMDWLGLNYDELEYQSERTRLYQEAAELLVQEGRGLRLSNGAVALKWYGCERKWHDKIAGDMYISDTDIEHMDGKTILLKGGDNLGQPTYQLTSTFDDLVMGVNYIIRGKDHISNTPKQLALWASLRDVYKLHAKTPEQPKFAHLGLIFMNKKKMSKRDGAASMLSYQANGIHADAMLNLLLRLGWSPADPNANTDGISKGEALQMFLHRGKMKNTDPSFDAGKLAFLDKLHKKAAKAA